MANPGTPGSTSRQPDLTTAGQTLDDRINDFLQKNSQRAQRYSQNINNSIQQNNALYNRAAMFGGAFAPLMQGLGSLGEGEYGEGLGQITGGVAGAAGAGAIASKALSKANPLVGLAGTTVASIFGGNIAGALGGGLGGFAEDKVGGVTGRGDSRGAQRKRSEQEAIQQAKNLGILGDAVLAPKIAAIKDLQMTAMNNRIIEEQRMNPIIRERLNEQLVRQQALNASMTNNYMNMGVVATAGKLATGAQEQAGANLRTALTTNVYKDSIMQAPNISFG